MFKIRKKVRTERDGRDLHKQEVSKVERSQTPWAHLHQGIRFSAQVIILSYTTLVICSLSSEVTRPLGGECFQSGKWRVQDLLFMI